MKECRLDWRKCFRFTQRLTQLSMLLVPYSTVASLCTLGLCIFPSESDGIKYDTIACKDASIAQVVRSVSRVGYVRF